MGIIDDSGYQKESFEDWLVAVEEYITEEDGEDVDLDPTGAWGQVATILSKFGSSNDEVQEEVYLTRDPDNATGVAATKLAAETGTYRRAATFTQVDDVLLLGSEGTLITAGSAITQAPEFFPVTGLLYSLIQEIYITKSQCRRVVLEAEVLTGAGNTYTVTIDSIPYTYVTGVGETQADAIDALILLLPSAILGVRTEDDIFTLDSAADMSISWNVNFAITELWSSGDFIANISGPIVCQPNSLTKIVTNISGWAGCTNPIAGTTGTEEESDTALMIRRKQELVKGLATDNALTTALNNVANVSYALAISNREMTVVDGQNPKSVESVVVGGADDDIAQAIYDTIGSGTEYFGRGGYSGTATDVLDGQQFVVPFSRPLAKYVHVRYTRVDNPESLYPGDTAVKDATFEYGSSRFGLGDDIIRSEFAIPFYQVPGSILQKIEIAVTDNPGDTPSWVETDKIELSSVEKGEFDADRVIVLVGP